MFALRATKKLRERIGQLPRPDGEPSTTVLGDWYATALPWRPQVALLVNEKTMVPVLMPLAPAASMPARVADAVRAVLIGLGRADEAVDEEVEQMRAWRIAPTASRSVVGVMNEFAFLAGAWRGQHGREQDLLALALRLARTPLGPLHGRHDFPDLELAALLPGAPPR